MSKLPDRVLHRFGLQRYQKPEIKKVKPEEIEKELGLFKSPWMIGLEEYNPDEVGLSKYKEMIKDAQVKAGLDLIEMAILSKPWHIYHPDPEVAKWTEQVLENLKDPDFTQALHEMLSAIWAGFSVTEVVWGYDKANQKVIIRPRTGLKVLDPETITFKTAPKGSLEEIKQTMGAEPITLDPERTFIWSFRKKFGNYYGESILRPVYTNWYAKRWLMGFSNIYMEQFGSPIYVGTVKEPGDIDAMEKTLKGLRVSGVAVLLEGWRIDVLEAKSRGDVPFLDYIRYQDEMIMRRLLIGSLVLTKERGGALALGQVHFDVFLMSIDAMRGDLVSLINAIINKLISFNFETEAPARFAFEPLTEEDLERLATVFTALIEAEVIAPDESWIRERLGFPAKPTPEEIAAEKKPLSTEEEKEVKPSKEAAGEPKKMTKRPHRIWWP